MCENGEDCSKRTEAEAAIEAASNALIAAFPVPDDATVVQMAERGSSIMSAATLALAKMLVEAATTELAPGKNAVIMSVVSEGLKECHNGLVTACCEEVQTKRAEGAFIGLQGGEPKRDSKDARRKDFLDRVKKLAEELGATMTTLDVG